LSRSVSTPQSSTTHRETPPWEAPGRLRFPLPKLTFITYYSDDEMNQLEEDELSEI